MSAAQPLPIETDIARWRRTLSASAASLKADEAWLVDAARRDLRAGRVTRTGLPSQTSGAGGGGRGKGGISDPTGESATGRVAAERGDREVTDDPFHEDVRQALADLEAAALHAGAAVQRIVRMRREQGETPNVQWCEACEPAGVRHPWDRFARDLRGLTAAAHLCDASYRFVDKHGRLPSAEEARYYDERGRWKIRIDPTATSIGVSA